MERLCVLDVKVSMRCGEEVCVTVDVEVGIRFE